MGSKSKEDLKLLKLTIAKRARIEALCESAWLPTVNTSRRESNKTSFRAIWPNFGSAISQLSHTRQVA